ncbi:carbohydrate ABC transporter permease [Mesorhizobium sp. BAC0120]|uniref:carbohydrate ABC transporter permease n=1 Tax=Mesorhizobium sp. BAC0120 TaxID=3090670 RepID=UPI00298D2231|nr:carbohydrate ABC transporter permease [Mesorhizobium sp. BAC0120]MDW6024388.1 carbohydrate ABC transporter permease [Mesorhizobium sp. BAC0120]
MSAEALTGTTAWLPRKRASGGRALLATLMLLVAVASAFPLVWMVLSSLKTTAETMQVPPVWLPRTPNLEAYEKVAGVVNVGRSMWNSLIIASITTAGILLTSMMAGYAFAKYRFRGRTLLFSVLIATMFLPPIVTLIPLYRMVGSMGLSTSLAGVILPNLANAFGIFLMRQFIAGVPDDLIDAARVDGASELLILFKIVMPSIAPAIAALALFAFVYHWNSYLWPLTVLQGNSENYPIVISLSRLLSYNRGAMNTGLVMAGATLAVLPPLILFVFLQKFFVDSIVGSGVKG